MAEPQDLRQFLLFAFALLIPCFVLWTMAGAVLAIPVIGLAHLILTAWFPEVVHAVYVQGAEAVLMTQFAELDGTPASHGSAAERVGFVINTRILSYSFPFFATLHFATHRQGRIADFLGGVLLLYALVLFGLVSLCLEELMVHLGNLFLQQPGVLVPNAFTIAILYQFNTLVLPTLAPVLLWAWQGRRSPLLRGLLQAATAGR